MEVAEARPECNALPVHDDNSIGSRQPEDVHDEMVHRAAEVAAPIRCQEADAMAEDRMAASVTEVPDPVMGGEGTSCMRQELPDVIGSYVLGELQGLQVTCTVDNGASDTIVNP